MYFSYNALQKLGIIFGVHFNFIAVNKPHQRNITSHV